MSGNTLSSDAYERIKQDILEGRLASDTPYSERTLAQRYDLSRTPLRSALATLEREGVINRITGGSAFVRSVSIEQFLEIVELRHSLESEGAALAAQNGMTGDLEKIRLAIKAYDTDEVISFDNFWTDDTLFHTSVLCAAGLPMIGQLVAELRDTARRCTIVQRYENFT
jgi:DNA-binding GntR family transcriptional regulator